MRHRRFWLLASAVLTISACSLYIGGPEQAPHVTGPDAGSTDHDGGGCGGAPDGGGWDVDAGTYPVDAYEVDAVTYPIDAPDAGTYEVDAGGCGGGNDGGSYGPDGGIAPPDAH